MRNNVFSISLDRIFSVKNIEKKREEYLFTNYKVNPNFSLFLSFLRHFLLKA